MSYYVVKKNENAVVKANNFFEYLLLKLGLEKVFQAFWQVFQSFLREVKSVIVLERVNNVVKDFLHYVARASSAFSL